MPRITTLTLAAMAVLMTSASAQTIPAGGMGAHLADGGGWTTTLLLTNFDVKANSAQVRFFGTDGQPLMLSFSVDGAPAVTDINRVIDLQPNATVRIQTTGAGSVPTTGWLNVTGIGGVKPVTGTLIFRQQISGRPDYEAAIPLTYAGKQRIVMQYDNSGGVDTGMAVVNGDSSGARITLTAYDEAGATATVSFTLTGGNQSSFVLKERLSGTAGKRGWILVDSDRPNLAILGFRFNQSGAFTALNVWN